MSNQGIRKKCIKICGTNSSSAGQEMFAFYWMRRFITLFTRPRHVSLSWAR
jgi:hypothetical protein